MDRRTRSVRWKSLYRQGIEEGYLQFLTGMMIHVHYTFPTRDDSGTLANLEIDKRGLVIGYEKSVVMDEEGHFSSKCKLFFNDGTFIPITSDAEITCVYADKSPLRRHMWRDEYMSYTWDEDKQTLRMVLLPEWSMNPRGIRLVGDMVEGFTGQAWTPLLQYQINTTVREAIQRCRDNGWITKTK